MKFMKKYDVCFMHLFTYYICGDLFQSFEHFYLSRKNKINACLFLSIHVDKERIEQCFKQKYNFDESEFEEIFSHIYIIPIKEFIKKRMYQTSFKIICFPGIHQLYQLYTGIIIQHQKAVAFACMPVDESRTIFNLEVFQDYRIYGDTFLNNKTYNYVRKLLLDKYKKPESNTEDTALIYIKNFVKNHTIENTIRMMKEYKFKKYLICVDKPFYPTFSKLKNAQVEVITLPIDDIFSKFSTYIYSLIKDNTDKVIDCSSRFLIECKYFNKDIIFDGDIKDKGLYFRKQDLENDIECLNLKDNDYFITYLKDNL
jgi:hypothetical protein